MIEQNYTFWFEGQDEEDGKEILAPNPEEAARMAVDIWRHEYRKEIGHKILIVYVKDEGGKLQQMEVSSSSPPLI